MRRPGLSRCGQPHRLDGRCPQPGGDEPAGGDDETACGRVEEEVVAGADDDQQHQRGIGGAEAAEPTLRGELRQRDADDQGVAEVGLGTAAIRL